MLNRSLEEWLEDLGSRHPNEIDLGLDRVGEVWCRLKRKISARFPAPKTIIVAGTNGKGSCIESMQVVLLEHGRSVGTFTSPHFLKYNERIRINGEQVSDQLIIEAFELIEDIRLEVTLTYFEFNALAALILFRRTKIDYMLLEVGLGGRLDAVNIIDSDVAVLTSIDLDHQEWLGNTRLKIGREKLGIARRDKPFIIGETNLPDGLAELATNTGASCLFLGHDFSFKLNSEATHFDAYLSSSELAATAYSIKVKDILPRNITLGLQALLCVGFKIKPKIGQQALSSLALTGRQQRLYHRDIPILFDVAHNPAAASVLAKRLSHNKSKTFAVSSVLNDKDWSGIVTELGPFVDEWFIAEIFDNPRAANAQQLLKMIYNQGLEGSCYKSITVAFLSALERARPIDEIVVFGSFHTVSEVMGIIKKENSCE